jgi:HK97 gp10 family phage protein
MPLKFEGGEALAKALGSLSQGVSRRIQREVLKDAAEPMRREMAILAPHEPGAPDLRDSMTISSARGEDEQEVAVAVGPSKAGFYGSFQEFGTAHHSAQPFARPAFDAKASESLRLIGQGLWRELAAKGVGRARTVEGPISEGGDEFISQGTTGTKLRASKKPFAAYPAPIAKRGRK